MKPAWEGKMFSSLNGSVPWGPAFMYRTPWSIINLEGASFRYASGSSAADGARSGCST